MRDREIGITDTSLTDEASQLIVWDDMLFAYQNAWYGLPYGVGNTNEKPDASRYFFGKTVNGWTEERADNPIVIEVRDRLHAYRAEDWLQVSPEMDKPLNGLTAEKGMKPDEMFSPANVFVSRKLDFADYNDFQRFLKGDPNYNTSDYNIDAEPAGINAILNNPAASNQEKDLALAYKIKQTPPLSLENYIYMYNMAPEYEKQHRFSAFHALVQKEYEYEGEKLSFNDYLKKLNEDLILAGASGNINTEAKDAMQSLLQDIVVSYQKDSWGYVRFYDEQNVDKFVDNSMTVIRTDDLDASGDRSVFNVGAILMGIDLAHSTAAAGKLRTDSQYIDMDTYLFNDNILVRTTPQNWPHYDILDLDDTISNGTAYANYNYQTFTRGIRDAGNTKVVQDGLMQYLTSYNNASEEDRIKYFPKLHILESYFKAGNGSASFSDHFSVSDPALNRAVLSYICNAFVEDEYYRYLSGSLANKQDFMALKTKSEVNAAVKNQLERPAGLQEVDEDALSFVDGDTWQQVVGAPDGSKIRRSKFGNYDL